MTHKLKGCSIFSGKMIRNPMKWFHGVRLGSKTEHLKPNSALDFNFFPESYYQRVHMKVKKYEKICCCDHYPMLGWEDYSPHFYETGIQTLFESILDEMFEKNCDESELVAKLTIWRLKDDRFGNAMFNNLNGPKLKYFLFHYKRAMFQLHGETGNGSFDPLSFVMKCFNSPLHKSFKEADLENLSIILNSGFELDFDESLKYSYAFFACGRDMHDRNDSTFLDYLKECTFTPLREYLGTQEAKNRIDNNSNIYKLSDKCFQVEEGEIGEHHRERAFQEIFTQLREASLIEMSKEFEDRHGKNTKRCSPILRKDFLILQILRAFASNPNNKKTMLEALDVIWRSIPDLYICPFELKYILAEYRYFVGRKDVALTQREYAESEILGFSNDIKPRSLKHLCRFQIRNCLIRNLQLPAGVQLLDIPSEFKSYLLLEL